ncbi:hypothetical protein ACA910_001017 [Epithemia clementina (nom. ined.)]
MGGVANMAFTGTNDNPSFTNDGFSMLAGAVLAIKHFNERNDSAVEELHHYMDCPVQIDIDNSLVFNTDGSFSHASSRSFFQSKDIPCAMVGPFSDFPAVELSVLAQAAQIPLVTARSFSLRVVSDVYSPFTSSVFPDAVASATQVVTFLQHQNRSNYTALLYPLSDVGFQRREALGFELDDRNMHWMSSAYTQDASMGYVSTSRSYLAAMRAIKNSGYRTIVIALDDPLVDMQPIADAVELLAMNRGDYFYVFYDVMEPSHVFEVENKNIQKLLFGAAWILPLSEDIIMDNMFWKSWTEQGQDSVDVLNALNPMKPGEEGYVFANSDFFQIAEPEYGSAYLYDAIMAAGIGACHALEMLGGTTNGTLTGADHNEGIRQSEFRGATGYIAFGQRQFFLGGARKLGTSSWGAINFLSEEQDWFDIPDMLFPGTEWINFVPFIFADNTTSPPALLRDLPEQNYLSPALRNLGFALMGISGLSAVCACMWVFVCRKHKVLTAAQPFFLYIVCFGTLVQSSTIISISFDESWGWNEKQLSQACMSVPWLLSLGHVIVYSALFTKLWRINKVLSFSRQRVKIKHVVGPMIALFMASIFILVLWTVLDPLKWDRRELNEQTGESIGQCQSKNIGAYVGPLLAIMIIPTLLTGLMAYKTKDVDEAFTESWWVFVLMLVQLEVIFVSAPVIAILRNESTDGEYLGFVVLLWSFPMSTLTLIFIPKVLAYRRAIRGVDVNQQPKRGEHKGTRVSGMEDIHSHSSEPYRTSSVEQSSWAEAPSSTVKVGNGGFENEFSNRSAHSRLEAVPEVKESKLASGTRMEAACYFGEVHGHEQETRRISDEPRLDCRMTADDNSNNGGVVTHDSATSNDEVAEFATSNGDSEELEPDEIEPETLSQSMREDVTLTQTQQAIPDEQVNKDRVEENKSDQALPCN